MEPRGVSEDNPSSPSSSNEQRAATEASTTSSRIPSHVFSSTNANSVAEWSVNSSESLFSINTGNTSFNDNLSWISKSEEIDPATISSPLFEFPVHNLTTPTEEAGSLKINDNGDGLKSDDNGDGSVDESQKKNDIDVEADNLVRSMSQLSQNSRKSFAFPILTGEADKTNSGKKDTKNKKQASAQHTPPETPKPLRVPEAPKAESTKATQRGCPKRWFSCFSCFPSCP